MRNGLILLAGCGLLVGCGKAADTPEAANNHQGAVAIATPTATVAVSPIGPPATDAWVGKWVGVEGLALDIQPGEKPATYKLHIALMDGASDYVGAADGDVIRFTRDGAAETIRHTNGADTGLKWLAEKKDCLTIKAGEGFCRD
jgi:hypothetical protein